MGIQLSFDCARHSTGHTEHKNSPNNLSNNCCCCISGAMEYNYYWTDSQSYFIIINFNHFSFRFLFWFFLWYFFHLVCHFEKTQRLETRKMGGGKKTCSTHIRTADNIKFQLNQMPTLYTQLLSGVFSPFLFWIFFFL